MHGLRYECGACVRLRRLQKRALWQRNAELQWQRHDMWWRNVSNLPTYRPNGSSLYDMRRRFFCSPREPSAGWHVGEDRTTENHRLKSSAVA